MFVAKLMPRFSLSSAAEHNWNEQNPLQYGITGTAKVDSNAGYSVKHFFGGPGPIIG